MNLSETRLDRLQLVDGVLLKAFRDTVRLPDGQRSVREWVRHPGASAVVPLFADGTTMLIRQFRYPPQREFLEVPAGKFDFEGEDPLEVARRELAEEVGLAAGALTPLGEMYPCIGYSNEVIHFYLAEDLTEVEAGTDEDEMVVPVRMPFAEALQMAHGGEILDGKTAFALTRAGFEIFRRDEPEH